MTDTTTGRKPRWRWLLLAIAGMAMFAGGASGIRHLQKLSLYLACGTQLQELGAAVRLYTLEASAELPPTALERAHALVEAGHLDPKCLTCPNGGAYVLLPEPRGQWAKEHLNPQTVIAYEPLTNHGGDGGNILFADGHVEFVRAEAYKSLIKRATSQPVAD